MKRIGMVALLAAAAASPVAAAPRHAPATALDAVRGGTFGGEHVRYHALIERYDTQDAAGRPATRVAAISYLRDGAAASRPVLFVFNGGPIAPSVYLHMGAFGPKRLAVPDDLDVPPTTFRIIENPDCPLDVADIVFFDPAGTGLSRVAAGVAPASQFNVAADARQLTQLVLAWTRGHGREGAPVYLVGESYGTLRAPEAARQLAAAGHAPAGVILMGQATNIIDTAQRRGNVISNAVSLPTLAAIAWAHGKVAHDRPFDAFMADAKAFSTGEYLSLLASGDDTPVRVDAVARKLSQLTGLSAATWKAHRLRISKPEYARLLLPGQRLGTSDARYVGPATGGDPFEPVQRAYANAFLRYMADDLKAPDAAAYAIDSPVPAGTEWGYADSASPFGAWDYAAPLGELFAKDPSFRLFVANGYYDTQTTIGAMDYLLAQNDWPAARVRHASYHGGHMLYTVPASLHALMRDVRAMVTRRW